MDLYKRYRPESIDDMYETSDLISVLPTMISNTLENKKGSKLPDCMIFHGDDPGIGKTTCAMNIVSALNPGINEEERQQIFSGQSNRVYRKYNGATSNGIDDVRILQKEINNLRNTMYPGTNYVYVIDEIHKYTEAAKAGLLDIAEFLPDNVFIIGTTTEYDQLFKSNESKALRSRFKAYKFFQLSEGQSIKLLMELAEKEGYTDLLTEDIAKNIYSLANGHPRELIQTLEMFLSNGKMPDAPVKEDDFIPRHKDFLESLIKLSISYTDYINHVSKALMEYKPDAYRVELIKTLYVVSLNSLSAMSRAESSNATLTAGEIFSKFGKRLSIITDEMVKELSYPAKSCMLLKMQNIYNKLTETVSLGFPDNLL